MLFVSSNNKPQSNNINFMKMTSYARQTPVANVTTPPIQNTDPPPNNEKKMEWGEPTWYLLHTLAEKVNSNYFDSIKGELLQTIYSICTNLPCPMCAQHATEYIKSSRFFQIKTKDELKYYLYTFHNVVNAKKNYPLFQYEKLTDKYSSAVTVTVIYNFMFHFQKRNKNVKMLANDMYRSRVVNSLKIWFSNNITKFDS